MPCQNYTDCNDIPNGLMCFCSPIFMRNLCKRLQTPHKTFPCMSNASCVKYEKDHHCSCMPGFTGKNCEKVTDHCRQLSINYLNEGWCFNIIGRFRYVCSPGSTRSLCWSVKNICLFPLYPCRCGAVSHDTCQAEVPCPPQFKYVCHMAVTGSEGEKCEVTSNTYFFVDANCTDDVVYVNKSEDHDYVCWFPCEGTMEMCANGCNCLTEEENKGYWCLCIPRWPGKMYLENTTDYQESGCQHEATYKDEINRYRCSYFLGCIERFCVLSGESCSGSHSTSVRGLCLVHLHNSNCSCQQRCGRNSSEIGAEDHKSVPCKNGATSTHLSGYFFCKGVQDLQDPQHYFP
ncbi:Protein eyes shut [Manis javanica]|nr:Protein eyes shut [Manis javanica]